MRPRVLPLIAWLSASALLAAYNIDGRHAWSGTTVSYYVNPTSIHGLTNFQTTLQLASDQWKLQTGEPVSFSYAGTTMLSGLGPNGRNVISLNPSTCQATLGFSCSGATNFYYDGTGHLTEFDMEFFEGGGFTWVPNGPPFSGCPPGSAYLAAVAVHEFGHALGMYHSDVKGAVMNPSTGGGCSTADYTLQPDDKAGICALYTCGTVTPPTLPGAPTMPMPATGSTVMGVASRALSWTTGGNTTSYTVYWGTTSPPKGAIATGVTGTSVMSPAQVAWTTYYWKVVARNANGTTSGPVWSYAVQP